MTGSAPADVSLELVLRRLERRGGRPPRPAVPVPPPAAELLRRLRPGQPGRDHLQDETEFVAAAKHGTLPTVSFVKPYGAENEHPGYASEPDGSDHLVDLLKTITTGPQAKDTLVVVTYDEFGGQWDHVAAARAGQPRRAACTTQFGPGHPHPGAADQRVVDAVRRGPHGLRHDVDPGHDRARPAAWPR